MRYIGKNANGFNQVSQSDLAVTVNGVDQILVTTSSLLYSGSAIITGSVLISGSRLLNAPSGIPSSKYALKIESGSGAIWSNNINVGTPTSFAWKTNLNGSYFNTYDQNTDVSDVLRFIAGLLSASAPSPVPNTKYFSSIQIQESNATNTVGPISGYLPNGITTAVSPDLAYLQNQGFIIQGGIAFSGLGGVYYQSYSASWRSVAGGSTTVSSSIDVELFGLGLNISPILPNVFNVSGAIFYRYEDNSTGGSSVIQSSSQYKISQNSFGSNNGLTIGSINTANPAVIPQTYQDGKFFSPVGFTASLYNGGNRSFTSVSSSGYYQITASVSIQSGSSTYSAAVSSPKRILWAPYPTIDTNIGTNTMSATAPVITSGSATSSSLSGAPYLKGVSYTYSTTASGVFNPMYAANAIVASTSTTTIAAAAGTTISVTRGGINTLSTLGGLIQTANAVYSSSGVVKSQSTVPTYNDEVRLSSTYTVAGTGYAMTETTPAATTFAVNTSAYNRKAILSILQNSTIPLFTAGTFGQPSSSGSMQYFGGYNETNTNTLNEYFATESYRRQIGSSANPGGTLWDKNKRLTLGNGGDLQCKVAFLVDPESTKGYWYPTSGYNANNYKWYLREFDTAAMVNKSNLLIALSGTTSANWVEFNNTIAGGIAVGVLFDYQIVNKGANKVVIFDAIKGNASYGGALDNQSANTSTNPFSDAVDVKGDFSSKSINSSTITLGLANSNNQKIDATNSKIWILIRYRGSATNSLTGITIATS